MTELQFSRESFEREVLAYHGLPSASGIAFVGIFFAGYLLGRNYLFSGLAAAIPSVILLWRWVKAGQRIDRWGCPNCRQPFPKKMFWNYPPNMCPTCGKPVRE